MAHRHMPKPDAKILIAVAIMIFSIATALNSYKYIYLKTPDHSFQLIIQAAQQGDSDSFSDMVDEKAVSEQLFDGMTARTDHTNEMQPVLQLVWAPIKAEFTNDAKTYLSCRIAWDTDNKEYLKSESSLNDCIRTLGFPLPLDGWHYVSCSFSRRTGEDTAEIDVTFHHDLLNKNVSCTFVMEQYRKNRWRISGVTNVSSFLNALDAAYQNELTIRNKPIRDKIDKAIKIENLSTQFIRSKDDKQVFLRIRYTPVIKGPADNIDNIIGIYELRRSNDNTTLYHAELRLNPNVSGTEHISQFLLNPLIPSQYAVMQLPGLEGTTSTLTVTSIHFKDGTNWKLADTLP